MKLWGIKNPKGKIVRVFFTKEDACWGAFNFQLDRFQTTYWQRYPASWIALKKKGWSVVPGYFQEGKEPIDLTAKLFKDISDLGRWHSNLKQGKGTKR